MKTLPDRSACLFRASALAALGLILAFPASGGGPAADPAAGAAGGKVFRVGVEPVRWSAAGLPVVATGAVKRRTEALLSFKVDGVVESVGVRPGDTVRKGDVLARLRPEEIESRVAQARSAVERARGDSERLQALVRQQAVSREQVDHAAATLAMAEADLRAAEFNQRFAVVTAPADGRILRRLVEPDELVGAGRPVVAFASETDGWILSVHLAEADAARVAVGDRAEVILPALGSGALRARVAQIAEAVDDATRTVEVELALDGIPPAAKSGFLAHATIHPQPGRARPEVPLAALVDGEGRHAAVFVVDEAGDRVRRLAVEVEALTPRSAYLAGGLEAGRLLVVLGADFLRDGARVEAVPAAEVHQVQR